jgi:alpha-beta hydrolase superfamily lysophospholipase
MSPVYYLPGANGQLHTGLGRGLVDRGCKVWGRATVGDFRTYQFSDQVEIVKEDLLGDLWHPDARIVANSYGGYLFLHAQLEIPPYIGRVLLLSPILGSFGNEAQAKFFVPPRADRIRSAVADGSYPTPLKMEIHVGSEDWQSNATEVEEFGRKVGVPVTVVPGLGHMLGAVYVGKVLDQWL